MPTSEDQISEWLANCSERKALENFAVNAAKKGRNDLRDAALKRSWKLAGLNYSDELDKDFHAMLAAYEHFLFLKHGKNIRAQRTWQKLANKGVIGCLTDWALDKSPTEGFLRLVEGGLAEFTGECVILRHADRFDPSIIVAAKTRLEEHGVTNCSRSTP
jgi:hypothetical protein